MVILKEKGRSYLMEIIKNKFASEDLYIGMEIIDKDQLSSI